MPIGSQQVSLALIYERMTDIIIQQGLVTSIACSHDPSIMGDMCPPVIGIFLPFGWCLSIHLALELCVHYIPP